MFYEHQRTDNRSWNGKNESRERINPSHSVLHSFVGDPARTAEIVFFLSLPDSDGKLRRTSLEKAEAEEMA
jgi:hypothetical protein